MLLELKEKILQQQQKEQNYTSGFKQVGDLVEELLLLKCPDKWVKLSLDHPTGFDFWDEQFNCFVDVKTCRAGQFGGNIFIEHHQSDYSGLSNHWKIDMDDDKDYYLFYFDVSQKNFGQWWAIDWRKTRAALQNSNHNIRGGYNARGDIVNAQAVSAASGRLVLS